MTRSSPGRFRLHQQVARALEEVHRARLEEHAAELAEHYAFSTDTSDVVKAVHYGELAARQATEVFAYGNGRASTRVAYNVPLAAIQPALRVIEGGAQSV